MATIQHDGLTLELDRIHVPENVRELDQEHVDALAGSIDLVGVLVPLVVRPADAGYELVAGFHRYAAASKLGLTGVPVVVREAVTEETDRAVENIARQQLNAYQEALAVKAMLTRGLTEDGAAQALGWPKQRVTARVKILELPERAQQLIGEGVIALSAVDQLRAIGKVAPALLDLVVAHVAHEGAWVSERLTREPGWVLDAALRAGSSKVFAAHMDGVNGHMIESLRLGKKANELYAEACTLHKKLQQYAYAGPDVRFSQAHVDQARAAGVLIEFERGRPIIVDRPLYRELVKDAIKTTTEHLRFRAADQAKQAKSTKGAKTPTDPVAIAKRTRDAELRGLADQAHGVNLDLGTSLLKGLAVVDPADMDVARFLAYALLGPDHAGGYGNIGERVERLAVGGIRLIIEELRSDVTKTRKDGTRGRVRMDYGSHNKPDAAQKWLWRYIDGAGTAGELYGRTLVVLIAEQHALRMVVPASQRGHRIRWGSHKSLAEKALRKLAGPHLPASLAKLERAVEQANATYEKAETDERKRNMRATAKARKDTAAATQEHEAAGAGDERHQHDAATTEDEPTITDDESTIAEDDLERDE